MSEYTKEDYEIMAYMMNQGIVIYPGLDDGDPSCTVRKEQKDRTGTVYIGKDRKRIKENTK
jgi:hypothetical protein